MTVQIQYFPFSGGLNLESSPLTASPGELIDCINYEQVTEGGYRRINGYTLYDGQATPATQPPGSGPIRGVHVYKGTVYAIRGDGVNDRLYKATASGWTEVDSLFTWTLGGDYRFCNYNFYGQDSQETMYIANGVDKAVQYDGTTLTEITTGAATDNPSIVMGYNFHLILAIGSSLMVSATGDPTDYQTANGAAEIAIGDTITNLSVSKGALMVGAQDGMSVMYGSSSVDFTLEKFNTTGTYANTINDISGLAVGLDAQGVMVLQPSDEYGNFQYNSLSSRVESIMEGFRTQSFSYVAQNKNQYRIVSGEQALYFTFNGSQLVGIGRIKYEHAMTCAAVGYDSNRQEIIIVGDSLGNVYLMDDGYDFNGTPIVAYFTTNFNHFSGPTQNKRFRLLAIDMITEGAGLGITVKGATDFGTGFRSLGEGSDQASYASGRYDYSNWDNFIYDAGYRTARKLRLSVTGENMAVAISSDGTDAGTHTIYGATVHYSPRRLKR